MSGLDYILSERKILSKQRRKFLNKWIKCSNDLFWRRAKFLLKMGETWLSNSIKEWDR
jgi:hypothetical protein